MRKAGCSLLQGGSEGGVGVITMTYQTTCGKYHHCSLLSNSTDNNCGYKEIFYISPLQTSTGGLKVCEGSWSGRGGGGDGGGRRGLRRRGCPKGGGQRGTRQNWEIQARFIFFWAENSFFDFLPISGLRWTSRITPSSRTKLLTTWPPLLTSYFPKINTCPRPFLETANFIYFRYGLTQK